MMRARLATTHPPHTRGPFSVSGSPAPPAEKKPPTPPTQDLLAMMSLLSHMCKV